MDISSKPNIVIIIVDALRPRDLSLYGAQRELDSNIKRIASESLFFKKNFSASDASDPSRASIFSGKYPANFGQIHQYPYIKENEMEIIKKNKFWLPVYLKNEGYSTFAVTPLYMWLKKGFDYVENSDGTKEGYRNVTRIKFIQKILLKLPHFVYRIGKWAVKDFHKDRLNQAKRSIDKAISKINETEGPFFVFMHLTDTHHPYDAAETPKVNGETSLKKVLETVPTISQKEYVKKRFVDASAKSIEQITLKRENSTIAVDKEIGRFYEFLKEKNILDKTVLIILADHGDSFGEHNIYYEHTGMYDVSVHTPLMIRIPKMKPKVVEELTQNIDVSPTILEILGKKKINVDGKSLLAFTKKNKKLRNEVFAFEGFCDDSRMVRTKTRKLILHDGSKCYLCGAIHGEKKEEYDLVKDPLELKNIYSGKSKLENKFKKFKDSNLA